MNMSCEAWLLYYSHQAHSVIKVCALLSQRAIKISKLFSGFLDGVFKCLATFFQSFTTFFQYRFT